MKPSKLWIDFETFSRVNIKTQGGYKYCKDDSTNVICLAYAVDDGPVELWTPAKPIPTIFNDYYLPQYKVYAHNATFDLRIWNQVFVRDFHVPIIHLDQCVDTAALAAVLQLPRSLKEACIAMDSPAKKNADGNRLIKLLCGPNKQGQQPLPIDPRYTQEFNKFYQYCIDDVESMRSFVQMLPRQELIPMEQATWECTFHMNERGLPVAIDEVIAIRGYLDKYIKLAVQRVPALTNGAINTVGQVAKIKQWCTDQGYPMANTQAATVEKALKDSECPDQVKELLRMRQELGRSSVAKFKKILALAVDGRVFDNLLYYGAGTGRWTGMGFQMQNLPRASVKDPDTYIKKFISMDQIDNPVGVSKALIRSVVKPIPGYSLLVSDYSSIENRVIAWFAQDEETLEEFRQGKDQYITMAASMYGIPYEEIYAGKKADDPVYSAMRGMGKMLVLGCAYQMGVDRFQESADEQWGLAMSHDEADVAVKAYRAKYHLIVDLWHSWQKACAKAMVTGERQTYKNVTFGTSTIMGTRWLAILLPSGRCMYYKDPRIDMQYIPKWEKMGRIPTVTHEGVNPYTRKWGRKALSPGRITENIVQGFARDIMANGLLNIQANMPEAKLIGCVHDEALSEIADEDITDDTLTRFGGHLCNCSFAPGLPLADEGYIAKRYKK